MVIIFLSMMLSGCTSLIFHPDSKRYSNIVSFEQHEQMLQSRDGVRIHTLHVKPHGPSKGVVLIVHGNAQNLSAHILGWVWLLEHNYELFIFDYRGYGQSTGSVDLKGSIEDTKQVIDYATTHFQAPIYLVGQSLGGALLINALAQMQPLHVKIKAVVIDSTYSDLQQIGAEVLRHNVFTWLFSWAAYVVLDGDYNPIDKVNKLEVPLLFVAGTKDSMISPNHSWQLFDAASRPKEFWLVNGAGHINTFDNSVMQAKLLDFFVDPQYEMHYSAMKIFDNFDKIAPLHPKGTP